MFIKDLLIFIIFINWKLIKSNNYCSKIFNQKIECSFKNFQHFINFNSSINIHNLRLTCDKHILQKEAQLLGYKFSALLNLKKLNIHNCGKNIVYSLPKLEQKFDLLNLSNNQLTKIEWKIFSQLYLTVLDLRNNPINCNSCKNSWLSLKFHSIQQYLLKYNWDIYTIFPQLPNIIELDKLKCRKLTKCYNESVKIDKSIVNETLNLFCHFK